LREGQLRPVTHENRRIAEAADLDLPSRTRLATIGERRLDA
jgi:hypothetical protein